MDEEIIPEADEKSETGECLDKEDLSASDETEPSLSHSTDEKVLDINTEVSINNEIIEVKDLGIVDADVLTPDETEINSEEFPSETSAPNLKSDKDDNKLSVNIESSIDSLSNNGSIQNISNGEQPKNVVNGKKKVKEGKPFSKVVVRRLPPSMTKEIFLDQVSPLPTYDYFYFVPASYSGPHDFSRAYLNFVNQDDLFDFTRTFDNYVFVDSKGHEYPAVVEFAPYQRIPKQRPSRKKDNLMGTIESDPLYVTFKEQLIAEAIESSKSANSMKQHYFETEINESEEVKTTPLLEFLKARRAEKIRIREEKKEERKRKEAERKLLKQKMKEKQLEQDQDQTSSDIKVLQTSKEKKELREKDTKKVKTKEREEKYGKHSSEGRTREFKNKGGKSYKEERLKQAERREEKKKKETEEVKDGVGVEEEETVEAEEKGWWEKKKSGKAGSNNTSEGSKGGRTFRRKEERKREGGSERRRSKMYKGRKESRESLNEGSKQEALPNPSDSPHNPSSMEPCVNNQSTEFQPPSSHSQEPPDMDGKNSDHKPANDPRAQRRIRNKDRPSIEIYRPGMGKFSRQRLEKEKSVTGDSPTHSPSPTPQQ